MRVHVGEFVLDHGRRELRRAEEIVHISAKAFRLLELLVERAPDAVAREDLYRDLWPDTFVEEANLSNLIKEIRKALGDDGRKQQLIKTLHGYGYALNVVPRAESAPAALWSSFVLEWGGREYPLREGESVVGRDRAADIRIDSSGVSRHHAALFADASGVTIRDLGSKNGTFVGDDRIESATGVADGVPVRLGSATFTIRRIGQNETTRTVASPSARPS